MEKIKSSGSSPAIFGSTVDNGFPMESYSHLCTDLWNRAWLYVGWVYWIYGYCEHRPLFQDPGQCLGRCAADPAWGEVEKAIELAWVSNQIELSHGE